MATVFESNIGVSQGRIQPTGEQPIEGDYSFVLGDEREVLAELDDGDSVTLEQSLDVTGIGLVRFGSITIAEPADAEGESLRWEISIELDASPVKTVRGRPGRSHTFEDLALDVHALNGVHTIGLTLALAPE